MAKAIFTDLRRWVVDGLTGIDSVMVGISVGQDRGLSEIGIIFDLFDQKICNIGSRYKAVSPTLGILKDLVAPCASTVC